MINKLKIWIVLAIGLFFVSCEKNFLEKRPDKALLVPRTLADMKALLENRSEVFSITPGLQLISADDFIQTQAAGTVIATQASGTLISGPLIFLRAASLAIGKAVISRFLSAISFWKE